jgi:hypothetical protein
MIAVLCVASPLCAQRIDQGAVRTHDRLLLRLSVGVGYAAMREKRDLVEAGLGGASQRRRERATLSGFGLSLGLDMGYAISDSVTLHARLSEVLLSEPEIEVEGETLEEPRDSARSVLLIAPAITYFLMPVNLVFSLAVGPAFVNHPRYDGDGNVGDLGIALNVDVGKEFWIGEQWGMGGVARFWLFASQGDAYPVGEQSAQGYSVALLASLSYQ